MVYAVLTFDLPDSLADSVAGLMHTQGALGVQIHDAEGTPPGARPPSAGRAAVHGYFDATVRVEDVRVRILAALEDDRIIAHVGTCRDEDWAETWKEHFPPLHVADRLWVVPPWVSRPAGPVVVIEPGMAFGTGAHETTALCLEMLAEIVPERPGASVLDVGCGSGILGLAARALGAGPVTMIDVDPDAVRIAADNAEQNGAVDGVSVSTTPVAQVQGLYHVVAANILSTTLVELAPAITARRAVGGTILLSGILVSQADEVLGAYEACGLRERERRASGEWAVLRLEGR